MQFDDIQQQAIIDLARFIAPNHFHYRGHTPAVYREIAGALLQNRPLDLTPRELAAAKALAAWVHHEQVERLAFELLVTDTGDAPKTLSEEKELEIAALRHNACDAAHTYARHVGNQLLIEAWPKPFWMANSDTQPQAEPTPVVEAPDPERRLVALRALGGTVTHRNGGWKFTGMALLVKSEKGRKRSDEKTIRGDLKEAAQAERDAKQAGAFVNGLGQLGR